MIAEPTERPQLRERLMKPTEVARLFAVEVTTVIDWVQAGRLSSIRTPGGSYRFRPADVAALLGSDTVTEGVA